MNPEDLKKQQDEEGFSVTDRRHHAEEEEAETPPEDVPEVEETHAEKLIPGLKEAKEQAAQPEPEVREMPPEEDPQLRRILQGFKVELTDTGEVIREFYGESQNVTLMLGLVKIMEMEIEQRQRLQRGFLPSAELTAMSGLARAMQNIGAVLVQVQGLLGTMNETMKAGFDETGKVESAVDAEPQQE